MKRIVATILTIAVMACLLWPNMAVAKDYKQEPQLAIMKVGDRVILDNGVVATYNGRTADGQYNFTAIISGPSYLDDLSTPINTIWHYEDGVYSMPDNLFTATVKGTAVTVSYDSESMSWNPDIYVNGKLAKVAYTDGSVVDDPINEHYCANTIRWYYNGFTRNLRAIEGVLIEYYVIDKPLGDIEIRLNSVKSAGYTYRQGIEVYDADDKPIRCTLTDDGVILTAKQLETAKFPVTIDPSSNFYTSASDGYILDGGWGTWAQDRAYATGYVYASSTDAYVSTDYDGAHGDYIIERGFVFFDTSSLPDASTVYDAKLWLYILGKADYNDAEIYIVSGMPTYPHDPLVSGDFYYGYYNFGTQYGWVDVSNYITIGHYEQINIEDSTLLQYIVNKTGPTKLALIERRDRENEAPGSNRPNGIRWASYEYGAGYRPYLEVTYTVVAPTVTVSAATLVTNTTARLNGNVVDTGGENPTVTVYWGDNDGGTTPASWDYSSAPTSPSQPQGAVAFYKDVTGLPENTKIYFKARAVNSGGTGWSSTLSFTTYGDPVMETQAASAIAKTTARLNSVVVNDNGLPVTVRFGWGTTSHTAIEDYDHYATVSGNYTTGQHPYLDVTDLDSNTLYYFMVEGTTNYGVGLGSVLNFTTLNIISDPSDFRGTPGATTVSLTWVKGEGASESVVRYGVNSYPTSPTDGFAVYAGTSASYLHTGLNSGTTYYYSVWGKSGGNYSTNYATLMVTTSADVSGGVGIEGGSPPSRWVSAPNYVNLSNIPIVYDMVNNIADVWGMPYETAWFLLAIFTSLGLGILLYMVSRHSIMVGLFTVGASMIGWWLVEILPFWIPVLAIIIIVVYYIGHQEVKTY